MDFSNFLWMRDELSLLAIILILFLYDTFATEKSRRAFSWVACLLLAAQTAFLFFNPVTGEAFGGMYQTSSIINIVKIVLNIGTLLVLIQANAWAKAPDMAIRRGEFYVLTLITLLGMYLMISSGNFLLFFIGLEMASLPLTALVAIEKYHQLSYEAAAKYVFVALFSSSLMLLGISFLYGAVGTLYFADVAANLVGTPLLYVGLVLFLAGMGFKISIVPFHLWTADVYQGAPTSITAYLSVFSSVAMIWQPVLWGLIVITITIGNLFAIRQKNLKRFMAFSSISQAGYILLGVIAGTAVGMTSLVYYVLVYIFSNLAIFGVISVIENATGKVNMEDYNGLYRTNPKLSVAMMLALFSLAGIPPFAGFFSKFFIFYAAVEEGFYVLVFIALLNTIVSLYYYLLVVKAMFIKQDDCAVPAIQSDGASKLSISLCVLGVVVIGLLSCIYTSITPLSFGM